MAEQPAETREPQPRQQEPGGRAGQPGDGQALGPGGRGDRRRGEKLGRVGGRSALVVLADVLPGRRDGPGGRLVEDTMARKCANVSFASAPLCSAMPLAWSRSNLNPEPTSLGKKVAGVMDAVAVMCATTSRTVQPGQSEAVDHCASLRPASSSARDDRSLWTTPQMSTDAMAPEVR